MRDMRMEAVARRRSRRARDNGITRKCRSYRTGIGRGGLSRVIKIVAAPPAISVIRSGVYPAKEKNTIMSNEIRFSKSVVQES